MLKRIVTAIILIPLVVMGIFYLSSLYFAIAVAIILSIAAWEWSALAGLKILWHRILYIGILWWGFAFAQMLPYMVVLWISCAWWLFALFLVTRYPNISGYDRCRTKCVTGFLVLVPCMSALICLHKQNPVYVLFILCIIWAADTGAYFAGRIWGKKKLAPAVSPKKTVAGLYGGLVLSLVVALIFAIIAKISWVQLLLWAILVIITVFAAVLGDLFESVLKRLANVKDSGQWLPGHGGILDRIDSITAAVPLFTLGLLLLEKYLWG